MQRETIRKSAIVSPCETYRYELRRVWDNELPLLVTVMVNPSRADAEVDDPTILTLIHFAEAWGYGGILVVNLFAFRSSTQDALKHAENPSGPDGLLAWDTALDYALDHQKPILVAWGNGGALNGADARFLDYAGLRGADFICLGMTKDGHPKHPLARGVHRIPRSQKPIPFVW